MIKRPVQVLMFLIMFLGLTVPEDSFGVLKPNLNAAQNKPAPKGAGTKPAAKAAGSKSSGTKSKAGKKKSKSKGKGKKSGTGNGKAAKAAAVKKIREAQKILDKAFGPKARNINRTLNQLNGTVKRLN